MAENTRQCHSGLLLILDDINGLAGSEDFANWLKSLVDQISTAKAALPVCILVVGLEECRQSLIKLQPSLARVFDLVDIRAWSSEETRRFFSSAFSKVSIGLDDDALDVLSRYAGGLPVLAHEIGDAAFAIDVDRRIDASDALSALLTAADIVGRKHLEPKVFSSISSRRYRGILRKIASEPLQSEFTRAAALQHLSGDEQRVFDDFLRKMVELGVVTREPEQGRGAYRFSSLLHYLYFFLEAERARGSSP